MEKILVIDDDVDICTLLSAFLTKKGFEVSKAHNAGGMMNLMKEKKFDAVLCDFRLGDMDGLEAISEIKKIDPAVPVIIITGYSDIKTAVTVIKSGAFDYVSKPLIPDEILLTINRALKASQGENAPVETNSKNEKPKQVRQEEGFITGVSKEANELFRQIDLVAPTIYSVIIYGESGSGKEAVARMIHERSKRSHQPFVALDCGAISRELAGSELFGHEKGSFTGAITQKIGHFELANGGTLFLDEVANLPFDVQTLLLRVVQEQTMKRIGGLKEIKLDVRIIVASNENLQEANRKGKFREDLYHRFNEFSIHVPSLRERQKDLMIFAEHFLSVANKELNKKINGFDPDVTDCFRQYNWPGNIREMKNVIKRAALLCDDEVLHAKFLPIEISNPDKFMQPGNSFSNTAATKTDLKSATHGAEYETIVKVLKQVNYNKSKAAKLLNIDRKTLYNKMKAYNL
ncbi:sigma-54 dependent transcriptional regulator [soil metagenome]